MNTPRRSILRSLWTLLLCIDATMLLAQSTPARELQCFSIHVRLNGKPVDDPQVVTLKTRQNESTASLEGGCFQVPVGLLAEKTIGISFTVTKNKISIPAVAAGFFSGPWDIELEDKKFDKGVLPKHARAREACAIVFHTGEPETELSVVPCRTPVLTPRTKAGEK